MQLCKKWLTIVNKKQRSMKELYSRKKNNIFIKFIFKKQLINSFKMIFHLNETDL